jgi:hypothetical protein
VKSEETPTENLRALLPKEEQRPGTGRTEDEFSPRYVQLPRRKAVGARNLLGGVVLLAIALVLLIGALLLGGPRALVPVVSCLLTLTALWVLAHLRLFRQRHSVFFAIGLVSVIGAAVALVERGYDALAQGIRTAQAANEAEPSAPGEPIPPLLTAEFGLGSPDTSRGQFVKVLKDSRVIIKDKPYLIKAGDIFRFDEQKENEITFIAKDVRISLPSDAAEVFGEKEAKVAGQTAPGEPPASKQPATPAQPTASKTSNVTLRSQQEAMRRYPALAAADSPENQIYVETYRELKGTRPDFFEDPEWPIQLADLIARNEGWQRADQPAPTEADSAAEPKKDELPPDSELEAGMADEPDTEAPADAADSLEPRDPLEP